MNLRHLAVFHAVAREGSISGAARALRIAQPAVSRQLRLLEASLGVALVDRQPRGIRLTEAGRVLADDARRIFSLVRRAEQTMRDFRDMAAGSLHLGASTTIANHFLPPVLGRFRRLHEGVDIRLQVGNTEMVHGLLLNDEVALGFTEGFVEHPELESIVFMRDELLLVARPDHPLARRGRIAVDELRAFGLVLREQGSGTRAVLERHLRAAGVEARPVMELGSTAAVKSAVLDGVGAGVISCMAVRSELEDGRLRQVEVEGPRMFRELHQVRHRDRGESPAIRAFLPLLREAARHAEAGLTAR